jgi:hypothetical protein
MLLKIVFSKQNANFEGELYSKELGQVEIEVNYL